MPSPGRSSIASLTLAALMVTASCGEDVSYTDAGPGDNGDLPDTQLVSTPAARSNAARAVFELASTPGGLDLQCSLDGAAATPCTSPHEVPVAEGEHTFTATAVDDAGVADPTPATFTWQVDLTPPDTTIPVAPEPVDNSTTVTFELMADEAATFACSLDGADATPCTSPLVIADLLDGAHLLEVTATDLAGNPDPSPATHAWALDTSTPDTQLVTGPTGVVASTSATFTFSSPDAGAGARYTCRLDGAAVVACTSPRTLTGLAQGAHTFAVQVEDATGNLDPTPATRTWTVDTVAPTAAITAGPVGPTSDATPEFTFTTAGAPTAVQCRVDSAAFAACTSPHTTAALADGARTFEVRATDAAGNTGTATRAFAVDTVAPTVAITGGPSGPTSDATPTFTFTTAGAPTTVQCRVGSAAFAACTSPHTTAALGDSAHTLEVRATDAAGNTATATRAFVVDTIAPTVSITGGPAGLTNDATPTFSFTTGGAPTSVQCRIDGGAPVNCSSPYTTPVLASGNYTFSATATDAAGNAATASRSFAVDAIPPTLSITSGPGDGEVWFNQTSVTYGFSASGHTGTQCRFYLSGQAAPAFTACTSPQTYGVTINRYTFEVQAYDAADNVVTRFRTFVNAAFI